MSNTCVRANRPDRDYVDGELVERNVGKYEPAPLQAPLAAWFESDLALVLPKMHPDVFVEPPSSCGRDSVTGRQLQ